MDITQQQARVALGGAAVVTVLLVWGLLRWQPLRSVLLVGKDGRPSTSKLAALLWTVVVAWVIALLVALAFLTGDQRLDVLLGAQLADEYLILLGGPFAALVAAKGIVNTKVNAGTLQRVPAGGPGDDGGGGTGEPDPAGGTADDLGEDADVGVQDEPAPQLAQVGGAAAYTTVGFEATTPPGTPGGFTKDDDGDADLVDLQYLLFNLLALAFVVISFVRSALALPDIAFRGTRNVTAMLDGTPFTLLPPIPAVLFALTGLGALTYVGNKAIQRNAPTLTAIIPVVARPNDIVTIRGTNFVPEGAPDETSSPNRGIVVTVGGEQAQFAGASTSTGASSSVRDRRLRIVVPDSVPVGIAAVCVATAAGATVERNMRIQAAKAHIRFTRPSRVTAGGTLAIHGTSFRPPAPVGQTSGPPAVRFGEEVVEPIDATDTEISVIVPSGAAGEVLVTVEPEWGEQSEPFPLQLDGGT